MDFSLIYYHVLLALIVMSPTDDNLTSKVSSLPLPSHPASIIIVVVVIRILYTLYSNPQPTIIPSPGPPSPYNLAFVQISFLRLFLGALFSSSATTPCPTALSYNSFPTRSASAKTRVLTVAPSRRFFLPRSVSSVHDRSYRRLKNKPGPPGGFGGVLGGNSTYPSRRD